MLKEVQHTLICEIDLIIDCNYYHWNLKYLRDLERFRFSWCGRRIIHNQRCDFKLRSMDINLIENGILSY